MTTNPAPAVERAISDREVRRGLRLNIISGCMGMSWAAIVTNMPFTMLLEELGANGMLQGLCFTILQLTLVVQIPGALLMETLPRRKIAWGVIAIVHRLIWLIPAYIAWLHPSPPIGAHIVVAAAAISMAIGNFVSSAWQSWMADLIPEQSRGRFWSNRQAWTMSAFLLAIAGSGLLLDFFHVKNTPGSLTGFTLLFGAAALLGTLDIVTHLYVPEPPVRRELRPLPLLERLIGPLQHPNFRRLAIAMGLWSFACSLAGSFPQLYARRVLNASFTEISCWNMAISLGTIAAGIGFGHVMDRIGARALGAVMLVVAPATGLSWFLVTNTPLTLHLPLMGELHTTWGMVLITVVGFFSAGAYSCVGLAHMSLLAATAPERGRTLAMAIQWTLIGLIGAGGSIVGGYVMDLFPPEGAALTLLHGTRFHFVHALIILHLLVIWFFVLPIFARIRVPRENTSVMEAFERIVLVNPLRFALGIYHARVMASPVTRRRRTEAVAATGESGAELFTSDLAARLSDPSADVREAAAQSLGRIGTRDARAALTRALAEESGTGLAVHLLRALRRCGDQESTATILPRLHDENIEVAREAARTLGVLADPAAIPPLLNLLQTTHHEPVAMAAAEALGHYNDTAAVYEIIPRMRTATTPMARRSFAMAAGDLLGQPDGFYRILTEEDLSHSAGIAPLLERMRTRLQAEAATTGTDHVPQALAELQQLTLQYDARNLLAAAATTYRLARLLGATRHHLPEPPDLNTLLTAAQKTDPRFAAGLWYLTTLNDAFERPQARVALTAARECIELQLAIYILASWAGCIPQGPGNVWSVLLLRTWQQLWSTSRLGRLFRRG